MQAIYLSEGGGDDGLEGPQAVLVPGSASRAQSSLCYFHKALVVKVSLLLIVGFGSRTPLQHHVAAQVELGVTVLAAEAIVCYNK